MMAETPSSAGDGTETPGTGVETLEVESMIIVALFLLYDIHFRDCLSLLHAIIQ